MEASVDLIFRIGAIGIITAILYQLLDHAGRKELATMTMLTALIVVMFIVVGEISALFETVKTLFGI